MPRTHDDAPTTVGGCRCCWASRGWCCAFPVTTLALALALAGVCCVYSDTHLGYKSSRLDLLNPNSDHNRLWIEYVNEFGDEDDAVIVVEGPGRDQVVPVLVELSASLGAKNACSTPSCTKSI